MTVSPRSAKTDTLRGTRTSPASAASPDWEEAERDDLLRELFHLRRRVRELEQAAVEGKRAKADLQDQLHLMQALIDTIPSPIFYKNTAGVFLGCNKAFESRLGLRRDQILGKTSRDLFPGELAEKYARMDATVMRGTGEHSHEDTIVYADGKEHIICLNKGTFTTAQGKVAGIVGVTVDITARRTAEETLRRTLDELEDRVETRTRELARANEELRLEMLEKEKAKEAERASVEQFKVFAHSVVHDLKSPSIGIHGLAKLLKRQYEAVLDDRGRHYCEQILNVSRNVVALVDQINAYLTAREVQLNRERVPMDEMVEAIREEFQGAFEKRHIQWSSPDRLPTLKADRLGLHRIFRNLVENALKYGGETLSRIAVGYDREGNRHIFSVQDNGKGIDPGDSEKIFGIFQRTQASRSIAGSGLGLAIVREIARQHEGEVWVKGEPGKGTTFYVSVPEVP